MLSHMDRMIDPSSLKITDMRFADMDGAPKRCTLLKQILFLGR